LNIIQIYGTFLSIQAEQRQDYCFFATSTTGAGMAENRLPQPAEDSNQSSQVFGGDKYDLDIPEEEQQAHMAGPA
jgi:hypothetical protein